MGFITCKNCPAWGECSSNLGSFECNKTQEIIKREEVKANNEMAAETALSFALDIVFPK